MWLFRRGHRQSAVAAPYSTAIPVTELHEA